jgi:putative transposase
VAKKNMSRPHTFIQLNETDEQTVRDLLKSGKHLSREYNRGQILLLNHEGRKLSEIANFLGLNYVSVTGIVNRYKTLGLQSALYDAPRSGAPRKITAKVEAHVTALVCSDQPEGQVRWTLALLHDNFIQLNQTEQLVDDLSKESIRTILKKVNLNLGKPKNGALKP